MIKVKKAKPTMRINYCLIPVTQTDSVEEFNEAYFEYAYRGYPRLIRTSSGGISISRENFTGVGIDVAINKWGVEMIIIDSQGSFRLQFRSKLKTCEDGKLNKIMSGTQCFMAFKAELAKIGIDIYDSAIENGGEIKKQFQKPMIFMERESFKDIPFDNVHHCDINSAHPSGIKEFIPEWGPVIDKYYQAKKEAEKDSFEYNYNKSILNLVWGILQSKHKGYKWAHISKYALDKTNENVTKMAKWLREHGRIVLLYNTDGIWFQGDPLPDDMLSDELGGWSIDHKNCRFRMRSAGAYEYIENGVYHPVLRGFTELDKYVDRSNWHWGDIYKDLAQNVIKYTWSWDRGVERVYGKES